MVPFSTRTSEKALTRRRVLVAGGAAAVALAGCTTTVEFDLEDVFVANNAPHPVAGAITVRDPADEVVLDEEFALTSPEEAGNETGNESGTGNETQGNEDGTNESGTGNESPTARDVRTDSTATSYGTQTGDGNETGGGNNTTDGNVSLGEILDEASSAVASHDDVLTESGDYAVAVSLDEGSEIRGESGIEQTVTVSDTDSQGILVGLASDEDDVAGNFAGPGPQTDQPLWVAVSEEEIEFTAEVNSTNSSE
jgi:hypothetical protein